MLGKKAFFFACLGFLFLLAFISSAFFLMATATGSSHLIHKSTEWIGGEITVDQVQGSLLSGLTMSNVKYNFGEKHITIQNASLQWDPWALFSGELSLKTLKANDLKLNDNTTKRISFSEINNFFSNLSLPFEFEIEKGHFTKIGINRNNIHIRIDELSLEGRAFSNGFKIKRLEAKSGGGQIHLKGEVLVSDDFKTIQSDFFWRGFRNGRKAEGKGSFKTQTPKSFYFSHLLRKPFLLHSEGQIELSPISADPDKLLKIEGKISSEAELKEHNVKDIILNIIDSSIPYRVAFQGEVHGQNLPRTHIKASGVGNPLNFHVKKIEANSSGGLVNMRGLFVWQTEPDLTLKINATGIEPRLLLPGLEGAVDLNANVQVRIRGGDSIYKISQMSADGQLMEQPFHATGKMAAKGRDLEIESFSARLGKNSMRAGGILKENIDIGFDFHFPDPGNLWTGFSGLFQGKGRLWGPKTNPTGSVFVEGEQIGYGLYSLERIQSQFKIDSTETDRSSGMMKLSNFQVGDHIIRNATFNWTGDFDSHDISVELSTDNEKVDVEFAGSAKKDKWDIFLGKAAIDSIENGHLNIVKPENLQISHRTLEPFELCWVQNKGGEGCISFSRDVESGWKYEGGFDSSPLRPIINLLTEFFKEENLLWEKVKHR